MALAAERMSEIFDVLPEKEKVLVYDFMLKLMPDDFVTQDDLDAHAAAMEEYSRGETVRHEDIDWD